MFNVDVDQADLYLQILHELQLPSVQIVEQVNLNDESISPALRGQSLIDDPIYQAILQAQSDRDAASHIESFILSDVPLSGASVNDLLKDLAKTLPSESLREYYTAPERTVQERAGVLAYLSSDNRLTLLASLLERAGHEEAIFETLADKLDNLLYYTSASERGQLLTSVVLQTNSALTSIQTEQVLRASKSLDDLQQVVSLVDSSTLLALHDREVNNYVALAVLRPLLTQISFPDIQQIFDSEGSIDTNTQALYDAVSNLAQTLQEHSELLNSDYVYELSRAVSESVSAFEDELNGASTLQERQSVLQRYSKIIELEVRYGVHITTGAADYLSRVADVDTCTADEFGVDLPLEFESTAPLKWSLEDLNELEFVLKSLPESDLHMTPLLNDIELVPSLGYGVLGARYTTGTIKIAQISIGLDSISEQYEGRSSLAVVLAHEIGHGIQISDGPSGIYVDSEGNFYFGKGADLHDFDEWIELSDWKMIHRDRYEMSSTYGTIILDGVEVPLNTPFEHNGERMVLLYRADFDILTSYNPDADFSSRWYAKTSPWEDFAEAFSEYILVPERLAHDAPLKFLHLEEEFKLYVNNTEITEILERALEERSLGDWHSEMK